MEEEDEEEEEEEVAFWLVSAAVFAEVSFSCQLPAFSSHAQNRRAVAALHSTLGFSAPQ